MGYFSTGSEGMDYKDRYCSRCRFDPGNDVDRICPVWNSHYLFNNDQFKNAEVKAILDMLMPRKPGGGGNEQCKMFAERPTTPLFDVTIEGKKASVQND